MYPISETALALFKAAYRQVLEIKFAGTAETITITDADVITGGMSVNRYSVSGNKIEVGSAVAAELTLKLENSDGRFDEITFEGAELFVRVGTMKWDAHKWENAVMHYVPIGYFTVDEGPRKLASINLSALDRMVLFDKDADTSQLAFPTTVEALISRLCNICSVPLETNVSELTNHDYVIEECPTDDNLTYRQLLAWCAEITGTCAYIDWNGRLRLEWYADSGTVIDASDRFTSDLQENSVVITGVQIKDGEDLYLVGDDGYALNIEGNSLIQHDIRAVAEAISENLIGFSYIPFTADVKSMPHLYPLDGITFVDKHGVPRQTIITDCTYTLNVGTSIEGKGETATKNGYASANPLTKRESAIIKALRDGENSVVNSRIASMLAFNELISNSLGLYVTPVQQSDGSTIYYMHNEAVLEESSTIFTMTSGGIAWTTTGWNDGNPVWSYGATSAGDALFKMLSAEGISVARAGSDYNIEITPNAFTIYYKQMLVTQIIADTMEIPKTIVSEYAECGKVRLVPYSPGGVLVGTNLVFID